MMQRTLNAVLKSTSSCKPQIALSSSSRIGRHTFLSSTGSSDEEGRPWGGASREEGPHQCSHWRDPPGSSSWSGVAERGMGPAAPAGNEFPSEVPPNDTPMLAPLSQLQRRGRSPRSSTHHLLPLSTAKHPTHPSQGGGSKLQAGCRDQLGLFLPPGSCGHGDTRHASYQKDDFCPPAPSLFSFLLPFSEGSQSRCSLTHALLPAQVLARHGPRWLAQVTFCCCLTIFTQPCPQVFLPFRILALS